VKRAARPNEEQLKRWSFQKDKKEQAGSFGFQPAFFD
jgi:hypothetical protein